MPKIDTRNFQKLLEEKRSIAPLYTPEWDVVDDRDTGVALLKIFTHMQEEIINRLNRVPDKNFTAFLEMIGLKLMPAQPARAPVTFYLPESLSGGVFVPAGTKVAADETEKHKALNFETTNGIFATSAAIEEIYCVDPAKDAIFKYSEDFRKGKEIELFEGENQQEHILYLGHDELFKLKGQATIKLKFTLSSGSVDNLKSFIWEYWGEDEKNPEIFDDVLAVPNENLIVLTSKGEIKKKEINGIKSHWICCRSEKVTGNTALPVIKKIQIKNVSPKKSKPEDIGFKPEDGFYNSIPLDLSSRFYPFGKQPRLFDTFYIASKEAFSKKNSTITITFKRDGAETEIPKPSPELQLSWEYWNGAVWEPLVITSDSITKFELTIINEDYQGQIIFDCPDIKELEVNGKKNNWIRVRIVEGNYGKEEFVQDSGKWKVDTSSIKPPVINKIGIQYSFEGKEEEIYLQHCLACNNLEYRDFTEESKGSTGFTPFIPFPEKEPALYLGFKDTFKKGNISIFFSLKDSDYPPDSRPKIEWTYWSKAPHLLKNITNPVEKKVAFVSTAGIGSNSELLFEETIDAGTITEIAIVDSPELNEIITLKKELNYKYTTNASVSKRTILEVTDNTEYLTRTGTLEFIGPPEQLKTHMFEKESYWLIGAFIKPAGMQLIKGIYPNTVWVEQVETIKDEILGSGDGDKNESYSFFKFPVISPEIWIRHEEIISEDEREAPAGEDIREIKDDTGKTIETWVRWKIVEDFADSGARSRHCTIDNSLGVVQFGDGEHGMIPPIGRDNIKATYKTGGGVLGNVMKNEIKALKASIAGIDHVTNHEPAEGGSDTELLEGVFERGPHLIKHRDRAVTREDFERLAKAASSYIARTKCLIKDNKLTVIIIPKGEDDKPQPSKGLKEIVKKSLFERSLNMILKESLVVTDPSYKEVKVTVDVIPESIDQVIPLEKKILKQLKEYLHPLTGGNEGIGWEFGRGVHISDVYALLESIKGVDHVENLMLNGSPVDVDVKEFETVCSGEHRITMKPGS